MTKFPATVLLLSTALACACASAGTLNFESLGSGNLGSASAVLPEAHISGTDTGTILYTNEYFVGDGGSVCSAFTTSTSTSCTGDLEISFTTAVNQLSLRAIGVDAGDSVTISAYAGSSLLGSQVVAAPQDAEPDPQKEVVLDFSTFSGVTKLVFEDQSTGSGLAYGKFSFTPLTSPVPEPATGVLTLLGAVALGLLVRRRQAA